MRTDYDPSAARWKVAREAGAYAAHALMFGFGYLPTGHKVERRRDMRTVVFVHGVAANRAGFLPLQAALKCRGISRHYSYNYPSRGASIEGLAVDLAKRLDRDVKGGRIDIVAHSMGGLVARSYLQMLGGDRRVDTLVTIGTPHQGSHATAWMPTRIISQLTPGGPFLTYLDSLPPPRGVRCVSIAPGDDLMVLPARAALWEHAEHEVYEGTGHLDVLLKPRLFRQVGDILEQAASPRVLAVTGPAVAA